MFLEICPFHLDYLIYWHTVVHIVFSLNISSHYLPVSMVSGEKLVDNLIDDHLYTMIRFSSSAFKMFVLDFQTGWSSLRFSDV